MSRKTKFFFIAAIFAAFILRFWNLNSIPFPPDGDEVAFGYYGWSILHFGTDEFGKVFPTSFSSIGDFKYPGLAYLNVIPAAFFGLSDISIRFLGATFGVLLVILVFLLARILFKDNRLSVVAAWFVAISPWAIIESRLGYEDLVSTVLTTAGLTCLLYVVESRKELFKQTLKVLSFVFLSIASFTHAAPRLFIPAVLLLTTGLSFLKDSPLKKYRKMLLIFLISMSLVISFSLLSPENRGRASEDVWNGINATEKNRLQELYVGSGISVIKIPARVSWFFNNKYKIALFDFLERYFTHFSSGFLFINGEASPQKIPDMGVLLFIDIFLLPFGLFAITKTKSKFSAAFIFIWLLVAPLPSALAVGEARMNRATLMIIPFSIISAMGTIYLVNLFRNKVRIIILGLLFVGIVLSSLYSLNQMFIQKPYDMPWYKQTVNESLTKEILNLRAKYKAVVTTDDDYIFFLFYGRISPKEFIANAQIQPISASKWERVDSLYNIYFKMPFECPKSGKINVLYVCGGGNVPQNSKIIKTFYYPDGIPAYSLLEFYPLSQLPAVLPPLSSNLHYMVDVEKSPKFPDGIIPDTYPSLW